MFCFFYYFKYRSLELKNNKILEEEINSEVLETYSLNNIFLNNNKTLYDIGKIYNGYIFNIEYSDKFYNNIKNNILEPFQKNYLMLVFKPKTSEISEIENYYLKIEKNIEDENIFIQQMDVLHDFLKTPPKRQNEKTKYWKINFQEKCRELYDKDINKYLKIQFKIEFTITKNIGQQFSIDFKINNEDKIEDEIKLIKNEDNRDFIEFISFQNNEGFNNINSLENLDLMDKNQHKTTLYFIKREGNYFTKLFM